MSDFSSLQDFLEPVQISKHLCKKEFSEGQVGKQIEVYEDDFPDLYDKDIIIVGCGEGALRILELQREGGRRLTVQEFLAGNPLKIGGKFE